MTQPESAAQAQTVAYHKAKWSFEEDQKLRQAVLRFGTTAWVNVANYVGNKRCPKQCRERWVDHLNPNLLSVGWSQTEDTIIVCMQKEYGNTWSKIASYLHGRSANSVKNRFRLIMARAKVDIGNYQSMQFLKSKDAENDIEADPKLTDETPLSDWGVWIDDEVSFD